MKFSTYAVATLALLSSADAFLPSNNNKPIIHAKHGEYKVGLSKHRNTQPIEIAAADLMLTRKTTTSMQMASFLDNIPNPLKKLTGGDDDEAVVPRPPDTPPPLVSNEAEALFSRARAIVAADLGLSDPTFLSDDTFEWIGPNVVSTGKLSKAEYLAAGKFFNLRSTFPDLDYRAHDFRLDPKDPLTVRFTARTVGTMRGELRLRGKDNQGEIIQPNGVRMVCPPEVISITFDAKTGKVTKLCSGFVIDRLVGNTGGLAGVQGAATVAGRPPSEWEIYPPSAVVSRFFGRSVKQLAEPSKVFLAPFPETVMIQLAKGVLAAELGTEDPDLLSEEFTFCGPIVGPLKKKEFLEAFSSFNIRDAFPDLEENYSNFRVDPYDPYRVWFDSKAEGTWTGPLAGKEPTGAKYIGPPEAGSMTFDDDGFCIRLTAGAVADPTECNTGGLGGVFGIFYATGNPLPSFSTRPLPQIISRAQMIALSPFTGKKVDDFIEIDASVSASASTSTTSPIPKPPPPPVPPTIVETAEAVTPPPPPVVKPKVVNPIEKLSSPAVPKAPPTPPVAKTAKKSFSVPPIDVEPEDPVSDVFSSLFGGSKSAEPAPAPVPVKKKKAVVPPKPPVDEPKDNLIAQQRAKLRAQAEERQKAAEERKVAAEQKRKEEEEARMKEAEAKKAEAKKMRTEAEQRRKEAEEAKLRTAEEKRAAAEQKRKEAEEARLRAAEERRAAAEQKRKEAEEARQRMVEERKAAVLAQKEEMEQKRAAAAAAIEQKRIEAKQKFSKVSAAAQAEKKIASAPKGATISLGFFGFGNKDDGEGNVVNVPKPAATGAPRGVPSLTKWTKNDDGSITGLISGSNAFPDGESVTTSRIKNDNPEGDTVVVTISGSRYFLDGKPAAPGFSFFGRGPKKTTSAPVASKSSAVEDAAVARKKRVEEQKAAAAAKKAEFDAARKAKQEEAKRLAAEKKAQIEAKQEEARAKREALEQAKQQKATAALAAKKAQISKKPKVDPKAASLLAGRKGSGTISLQPEDSAPSFFSFGKKSDDAKSAKPPAGVPVINKFKKNRDGSVTGFITGSSSFREGERITTSKLAANQKVEAGSVVTTVSGSKYFLK